MRFGILDPPDCPELSKKSPPPTSNTWVNHGFARDWIDPMQGEGKAFGQATGEECLDSLREFLFSSFGAFQPFPRYNFRK